MNKHLINVINQYISLPLQYREELLEQTSWLLSDGGYMIILLFVSQIVDIK